MVHICKGWPARNNIHAVLNCRNVPDYSFWGKNILSGLAYT